jgi:hypothetical protein
MGAKARVFDADLLANSRFLLQRMSSSSLVSIGLLEFHMQSLSKASLSRTSSRAGRGFGNADNDLAYSTQPSELAHIQRLHAQLLVRGF